MRFFDQPWSPRILCLASSLMVSFAAQCAAQNTIWMTRRSHGEKRRAGLTDKVMPPYTPLIRVGEQVRSWGRVYSLGGLFPTAVTSQNEDIYVPADHGAGSHRREMGSSHVRHECVFLGGAAPVRIRSRGHRKQPSSGDGKHNRIRWLDPVRFNALERATCHC